MQSLEVWLSRLVAVHPEQIELGLERSRAVYRACGNPSPAPLVISVAGTNGKGSTVAFLVAMLRAAGYRVGAYTSPHLLRFNERMQVDGVDASDQEIVAAFRQVEAARGEVALTFFEYATLAAIHLFSTRNLDVAVFEVGLGGRLDAVNLLDADVAIVTTVDLDHEQLLGHTREAIAVEKAGIFRAGCPAVIGESDPPASLIAEAGRIGARTVRAGHEYRVEIEPDGWRWIGYGTSLRLPHPGLRAPVQHFNAAAAIAALMALRERIPVPFRALRVGLIEAQVRGRLEVIPGIVETVLDVAHNPQAARVLADWLRQHPRRTHAVFSALADKDIPGIVEPLLSRVQYWHLAGMSHLSARGLSAAEVQARVAGLVDPARSTAHENPDGAWQEAKRMAREGDRILVFGSFFLVSALAPALNAAPAPAN